MDEKELISRLSKKTSLDEKKAAEVVAAFSEALAETFKKGEKVVLAEFGSFFIKDDKTIQFHPSARLKSLIE